VRLFSGTETVSLLMPRIHADLPLAPDAAIISCHLLTKEKYHTKEKRYSEPDIIRFFLNIFPIVEYPNNRGSNVIEPHEKDTHSSYVVDSLVALTGDYQLKPFRNRS
jgi:hypothetical protein